MDNVKDFAAIVERGLVHEIDGKPFSPVSMKRVIHDPQPQPLGIQTLNGLVEYCRQKIDKHGKDIFIMVEAPNFVRLSQEVNRETMSRNTFLDVELPETRGFTFGQFTDIENFLIMLKSMFCATPDREKLLKFVSQVTVDDSLKTLDDGVSQSVAVSKGISGALKEKQVAPSIVTLAPFRTFREAEQPASEFLFRMRSYGAGQMPQCALFEADGGGWKIQAVKNVADWLKEQIKGIPVLA